MPITSDKKKCLNFSFRKFNKQFILASPHQQQPHQTQHQIQQPQPTMSPPQQSPIDTSPSLAKHQQHQHSMQQQQQQQQVSEFYYTFPPLSGKRPSNEFHFQLTQCFIQKFERKMIT